MGIAGQPNHGLHDLTANARKARKFIGAEERTRTSTSSRSLPPQGSVSTNFTTSACVGPVGQTLGTLESTGSPGAVNFESGFAFVEFESGGDGCAGTLCAPFDGAGAES